MSELKDCPFCGGKAEILGKTKGFSVGCECGIGLVECCWSSDKAIEIWNNREPQDNWISVDDIKEPYVFDKVIFVVGDEIYAGSVDVDDGEIYFQDNDHEIYDGVTHFKVESLPTKETK